MLELLDLIMEQGTEAAEVEGQEEEEGVEEEAVVVVVEAEDLSLNQPILWQTSNSVRIT